MGELVDLHRHEHQGPGTIRNHPYSSLKYSLSRIAEILADSED
jgi:hypothetical protein